MRRHNIIYRSKILKKPLQATLNFEKSDIPPIAKLEGVDLVTEGVITVNRVLEYAKDYLGNNEMYEHWNFKRDGASLICQLLFEEATDINFYVGRAVNPAHQNPDLPINFNIKMNLVEELSKSLRQKSILSVYPLGKGAQTNILPLLSGTSQPIFLSPLQRVSRLSSYNLFCFLTVSKGPLRAAMAAY